MEIQVNDLVQIIGQMQIRIILLESELEILKKEKENGTVSDGNS